MPESRDVKGAKVACAIARTALAAGVPIADALAIVAAAIAPLLYDCLLYTSDAADE